MALLRKRMMGIGSIALIALMVVGSFSIVGFGENARTGTNANEPVTGFSEGVEKIEVYHDNGDHNTEYNIDENLNIRITTNIVTTLPNKDNDNRVIVTDYLGNPVGADHKPFFVDATGGGGPPYVYEGSFVLSNANGFTVNDDYLLSVILREGGPNKVVLQDVIHVGGATSPEEKHIKLFEDPSYSTEAYDFSPTSTLYVEVWTGSNPADNTTSEVTILDYIGGVDSPPLISSLANPAITEVGNYSRFAYDLTADFGGGQFDLNHGYWYSLSVLMNDGTSDQIADWSVQFRINNTLANPPVVVQGATVAAPTPIIVGVESTVISTNFTHADAPDPSFFVITYNVKDEAETEYPIVDQRSNGQGGLSVTQDGVDPTKYKASFTWAPGPGQVIGLYDLYFKVDDGTNVAEDDYLNNEDALELLAPASPPIINAGDTTAVPGEVYREGTNTTVLSVTFSHADAPSIDSFKISFRVRDPGNNQIHIVDNVPTGTNGVLVAKTGNTTYKANVSWNPPDNAVIGYYDLFSRVEDYNGVPADDGFGANPDELLVTRVANVPVLISGATEVDPDQINRTGNEVTVLSTLFTHSDQPGVTAFTVTYMVRDEDDVNRTLVDYKKHGNGGLSIQDLGNGTYRAIFSWDPPDTALLGTYDLYMMVEDALGVKAYDTFDNNLEELTLTKRPTPPKMTAGVTSVDPSEVNIAGNDTTKISTTFTHEDLPDIGTFKITFKIRDVGNQEYILINSATNGTPGLSITSTVAGTYIASFIWDPPSVNQPLGTYDLYSSIIDFRGLRVEDGFTNNLEELKLIKQTVAPGNATIKGTVTDIEGKPITNATIKVYDSNTGEVVKTATVLSDGSFSFELPAGTYDVAVQAPSFKGEAKDSQILTPDQVLDLGSFSLIKLQGGGTGTTKTITKEVIPGAMYGIIGLLIVIIIVLIILLGMKMTKGPIEPSGGETRSGHHQHVKDEDELEPDHPIKPREKKEIEDEPKPIDPDKVEIQKMKDDD